MSNRNSMDPKPGNSSMQTMETLQQQLSADAQAYARQQNNSHRASHAPTIKQLQQKATADAEAYAQQQQQRTSNHMGDTLRRQTGERMPLGPAQNSSGAGSGSDSRRLPVNMYSSAYAYPTTTASAAAAAMYSPDRPPASNQVANRPIGQPQPAAAAAMYSPDRPPASHPAAAAAQSSDQPDFNDIDTMSPEELRQALRRQMAQPSRKRPAEAEQKQAEEDAGREDDQAAETVNKRSKTEQAAAAAAATPDEESLTIEDFQRIFTNNIAMPLFTGAAAFAHGVAHHGSCLARVTQANIENAKEFVSTYSAAYDRSRVMRAGAMAMGTAVAAGAAEAVIGAFAGRRAAAIAAAPLRAMGAAASAGILSQAMSSYSTQATSYQYTPDTAAAAAPAAPASSSSVFASGQGQRLGSLAAPRLQTERERRADALERKAAPDKSK